MSRKFKWTQKMKDELCYTKNPTVISKKYKMSYETARKKLLELLNVKGLKELEENKIVKKETKPAIENNEFASQVSKVYESTAIKEEPVIIKEENKNEIFKNIEKIIVDIEGLNNKGINFYITDSRKQISEYDKIISDYRHALENSYDTLSENELIQISKNIGLVSRKRRLFKNEIDFIQNHKTETQGFLDFIKKINEETIKLENRLYSTRVLKENIGDVLVLNKNNSIIKDLENENEELKEQLSKLSESQQGPSLTDDIKERLFILEKNDLKEERKKQRNNGDKVAIDYLLPNWKELFNTELDEITKNGIISDCYAKYKGVDIKEVRDMKVWGSIIPEYLFQKKYFIKEK